MQPNLFPLNHVIYVIVRLKQHLLDTNASFLQRVYSHSKDVRRYITRLHKEAGWTPGVSGGMTGADSDDMNRGILGIVVRTGDQ